MNITLTGFMGTGKTAVGKRFAKRLGWAFVDTDRAIEASTGKTIPQIFAQHGEAVFRRLEKRAIRLAARADEQVIAIGGGAFVDPQNQHRLRALGPVVCLTAHPRVILERVGPSLANRPMLSPSVGAPLTRIQKLLRQRSPAYAKADLTIDTSRLTIDEIVERMWAELTPWMSRSWHYLLTHRAQLTHRYGGRYVVVLDDRVVAAGASHLKAYQCLRRPVPRGCEVGIYYIPSPEEAPIAL